MPIPFPGRGARRSALALISAGAVVAGALTALPAATAAGDQQGDLKSVDRARPSLDGGRYVVVLRAPGAASYRGGEDGLSATRKGPNQSFDAQSPAVQKYSRFLASQQASVAKSVGAKVDNGYTIGLNGFSAALSGKQAALLSTDKRVLFVSKDVTRKVDTWNTPDFLGLSGRKGAWATQAGNRRNAGQGTVVGVIDSGIWPESKSFKGFTLSSKPRSKYDLSRTGTATRMEKRDGTVFNGECQTSYAGVAAEDWSVSDCSTKLIGARYYPGPFLSGVAPGDRSPTEVISTRDGGGHGSHTASTAAGEIVRGVKVEGTKFGKLSGMAPGARIAAYKVCFDDNDPDTGGCYTSSILDAVDDAIADNVDTINFSISGAVDTVIDPVEFAFEGAAEAGIFVAASAGNSGPDASTVAHNSPWLTTVASSTHVNFINTVILGNGKQIRGASIASTALPQTTLITSTDAAAAGADPDEARQCFLDTLDAAKAKGKIVVCDRGVIARVDKSKSVASAGGVGMILVNTSPSSLDADFHAVPTIHISDVDGPRLYRYISRAGAKATAAFVLGDKTGAKPIPLPQISGFSSRGPALANGGDLLKPDIAAPGSSVLAAVAPPSNEGRDYDLYSGTSMASPHIAGLANFIMSEHPNWTPMEVKSAMMTSAKSLKNVNGKASRDVLASGAGQVRPVSFADPGLFVTAGATDWLRFLQGQGLDLGVEPLAAKDLNVPSMAQSDVIGSTTFVRQFQGSRKGTWKVSAKVPGFKVTSKKRIVIKRPGDLENLRVKLTRTTAPFGSYAKGYVTLSGPSSRVRLPVAVQALQLSAPAEVAGDGVSGSVDVPVTAADTAPLGITANGLAESTSVESVVTVGDSDTYCVSGGDALVHRFSLDSVNDAADLDLYVYPVDACDSASANGEYVSATGSADEQVTIENPSASTYLIYVDGYEEAPGQSGIDYRLDVFDVAAGAGVGGLTATPNPLPLVSGEESVYQAQWNGLDTNARYMGVFQYDGTDVRTNLTVDTLN